MGFAAGRGPPLANSSLPGPSRCTSCLRRPAPRHRQTKTSSGRDFVEPASWKAISTLGSCMNSSGFSSVPAVAAPARQSAKIGQIVRTRFMPPSTQKARCALHSPGRTRQAYSRTRGGRYPKPVAAIRKVQKSIRQNRREPANWGRNHCRSRRRHGRMCRTGRFAGENARCSPRRGGSAPLPQSRCR
jgi:hypothetical protein